MATQQVKTKPSEAALALAKETGVNPEDVEKILTRIGLYRLPKERALKIKPGDMRIAMGDVPM